MNISNKLLTLSYKWNQCVLRAKPRGNVITHYCFPEVHTSESLFLSMSSEFTTSKKQDIYLFPSVSTEVQGFHCCSSWQSLWAAEEQSFNNEKLLFFIHNVYCICPMNTTSVFIDLAWENSDWVNNTGKFDLTMSSELFVLNLSYSCTTEIWNRVEPLIYKTAHWDINLCVIEMFYVGSLRIILNPLTSVFPRVQDLWYRLIHCSGRLGRYWMMYWEPSKFPLRCQEQSLLNFACL